MKIFLWIARIYSAIAVSFILIMFVGHLIGDGVLPFLEMTLHESVMMSLFILLWAGLVISWKFELAGGITTVGSLIAFYLSDYIFSGTLPRGPYFLLLGIPGVLFVLYGIKNRADN